MIQEANLGWAYIDTETKLVMPWYTLPTLQWLKTMDVSQWHVFEYGGGYSSIWWRVNSAFLKNVDGDDNWATAAGAWLAKTETTYVTAINDGHEYDCVVIDGDYREKCLNYCINFLKRGGFLIIDNWLGEDFTPEMVSRTEILLEGWKKQLFKQPNHSQWTTAVFYKPL